jgi:tRNA/tmRNA/rRNA uracil-C5-methylase (TrmA/RlmC/RlmD family)
VVENGPGADLIVRVERPAVGGGVGRAEDGRVVFVRHALVDELVRARVSEVTSRFYRADAVEVLEVSPGRVVPPCPYAHPGGCGGCDLQHASRETQLAWTSSIVVEQLRRVAGVTLEVTTRPTPSPVKGSRTRLRCAVDAEGRLSLRAARSHDLVAIDPCWIADERLVGAFSHEWSAFAEVELRAIGTGEPFAVCRRDGARLGDYEVRSLGGSQTSPTAQSRVAVDNFVYAVSPLSFWQSHRDAASVLLDTVEEFARVEPGDDVVDLFGGVGLFGVSLAKSVGPKGRVRVVESSSDAARDARENAAGLAQLKVREWSVTPRAVNDSVAPDSLVVLDPPRQGLAKGVVDALARRWPRRLVYVSCDAATFARDLKGFLAAEFVLSDLRVFDLFPMTEHVELVALLDRQTQKVDSAGEAEFLRDH